MITCVSVCVAKNAQLMDCQKKKRWQSSSCRDGQQQRLPCIIGTRQRHK